MTRRAILPAVALLFAAIVSACGSSSNPTATANIAGATATPTQPAPTPAPASTAPLPTGPLASFALPSFDLHAAPDLEASLPSTIGGQQVQKYSFSLAQLSALGQATANDETFLKFVQALGKNPSDVTMALAYTSGTPSLTAGALRVNGANQSALIAGFQQASEQSGMSATQATVGGKQVVKVASSESPEDVSYVYAKGDTLYFTQAPDDSTASTVIQALP